MNEKSLKDVADKTIISLLEVCKEEADPRLIEAVASLIEDCPLNPPPFEMESISNEELQEISSSMITDYNNNDTSHLLEYSARLNSIT